MTSRLIISNLVASEPLDYDFPLEQSDTFPQLSIANCQAMDLEQKPGLLETWSPHAALGFLVGTQVHRLSNLEKFKSGLSLFIVRNLDFSSATQPANFAILQKGKGNETPSLQRIFLAFDLILGATSCTALVPLPPPSPPIAGLTTCSFQVSPKKLPGFLHCIAPSSSIQNTYSALDSRYSPVLGLDKERLTD